MRFTPRARNQLYAEASMCDSDIVEQVTTRLLNEKCQKVDCDNLATTPHSCPYAGEIHDDYESECNCCDECTHECAMDI